MLELSQVSVSFGGVQALNAVSMVIEPETICGLIGPNGAGKTTLFNCISGVYPVQTGMISYCNTPLLGSKPHDIAALGISRTFQNLGLISGLTVLENVLLGTHVNTKMGLLATALTFASGRREERQNRQWCHELLARFGLKDIASSSIGDLSYGTLKRVELARAMAARPKLLMLDEPAGGLTQAEVQELGILIVELRREFHLTVLLVEHHMPFVMGLSDRVVALDQGAVIASGPPAEVQRHRDVISAYLGGS
jgi:branched-chain amino acid transport system ATP-binding protein